MRPWLKAGLIGAGILTALALMTLIPLAGACCCFVWPVAYLGVGALAGSYVPPVRDPGVAAGQGALAAALAQLLGGLVYTVIVTVQSAAVDMSQVTSDLITAWGQAGLDTAALERFLATLPAWLSGQGSGLLTGLVSGSLCLVVGLLTAAILGALGGMAFASAKRE